MELEERWQEFVKLYLPWPIKYGEFNCNIYREFCSEKNFFSSRIVMMFTPEKQDGNLVTLHYTKQDTFSLKNWINRETSKVILTEIKRLDHLDEWIDHDIPQILFASPLNRRPTFIMMLAIVYKNMFKFAHINTENSVVKRFLSDKKFFDINNKKKGQIILFYKGITYNYGNLNTEIISFVSIEYFLDSLSLTTDKCTYFFITFVNSVFILRLFKGDTDISTIMIPIIAYNTAALFISATFVNFFDTLVHKLQYMYVNLRLTWPINEILSLIIIFIRLNVIEQIIHLTKFITLLFLFFYQVPKLKKILYPNKLHK